MMAVEVTNELGRNYVFEGSAGKRQIGPGETQIISDLEWSTVISSYRGPGKLNASLGSSGGGGGGATTLTVYALELDDVGGGVTYVGEALPGALTSASAWRIKRITEVGPDITIEWADGDSLLNNVWDDHLTLDYS